jgi:fatty acid desaturase
MEPDSESLPCAGQGMLSPSELRQRFAPDFEPRRWLYWLDMLLSAAVGWTLFGLSASLPFGSPLHVAASLGAVFALLRAVLFIHELAHRRAGDLPGFELAWNLLVGIPVQVPSLMYVDSHLDHHKRTAFGTVADPEYAPIARWSRLRIASFVLTVATLPVVMPIRWAVIGPLSYLFPPLRRLAVRRMSTLVINGRYRRPEPRQRQRARWQAQEAGAALFAWALAGAVALGWVPLALVGQWWLVSSGVWIVNQVRTLAAHGYEHAGEPVDTQGQLLDSINLRGGILFTSLVAPVGLRYHALHHYLPTLPYHSLGRVHRQLLRQLPADSPYRRTLRGGLLEHLQKVWDRAATPVPG